MTLRPTFIVGSNAGSGWYSRPLLRAGFGACHPQARFLLVHLLNDKDIGPLAPWAVPRGMLTFAGRGHHLVAGVNELVVFF